MQKAADVPHADLVIACTSADECNMLSCLIARKLGARHTIAACVIRFILNRSVF